MGAGRSGDRLPSGCRAVGGSKGAGVLESLALVDPVVRRATAVLVEVPAVRLGVADQPGVADVLGDRVVALESADRGGHDAKVTATVSFDVPTDVATRTRDLHLF